MSHKKSIVKILSPKKNAEHERPDIFNKNGEIRFWYSFQFQLIKSALLSLLFTLLTEFLLTLLLLFLGFFTSTLDATQASHTVPNRIQTEASNSKSTMKHTFQHYFEEQEPWEEHFPAAKNLLKKQHLYLLLFFIIICSLSLFIVYFLLLTRRLSAYLAEITLGINKIAEGDFEALIPVKTQDEFGLIAGCINEMSEQIQKNIELERKAEQEKNQLITSVAHDIRTPLTSILGYLELLYSQSSDENIPLAVQKDYLRIAYEKSKRLMTLTEDLFTYTKVSFHELKVQPQPLDLILFLEQMIEEFYPLFVDANLTYSFIHSVSSIPITGDSSLLARAFSNLLSNAVKYGKDGKELCISVRVLAESAIINITNYGTLIPKQSLEHIFERFYRVENSRSLDTGGSGLGLAIAQRIILLHDGTIKATSSHDGTSFIVTLPLSQHIRS